MAVKSFLIGTVEVNDENDMVGTSGIFPYGDGTALRDPGLSALLSARGG